MTSTADTQAPNPRDCEHGQLRRSCELCAALVEIDALQATVTRRGELLRRAGAYIHRFAESEPWIVADIVAELAEDDR